jgi:hypothetical protein
MRYLKIDQVAKGSDVHLKLSGMLDENAALPEFPLGIAGRLEIDLQSLTMINSLGCRVWAKWIKTVNAKTGVHLLGCSSAFIAQVNVLQNFIPSTVHIESMQVPYTCLKCNHSEKAVYPVATAETAPETCPCPRCGGSMELTVVRAKYFHFLQKKSA